jgi:Leu/Phe-tRNA-protein transferase
MTPKIKETLSVRPVKVKEVVTTEKSTDFSEAISSIEHDLIKYRLGIFRINFKDISFKWTDRKNRGLGIMECMTKLRINMQNGLYRIDIHHRMSDIITHIKIEKQITSPIKSSESITLDRIKELNEEVIFPNILFPKAYKYKIEM